MLTCKGGVLTALPGRISPLRAAVPRVASIAWSPGTARSCARVGLERRSSWDAPPIAEWPGVQSSCHPTQFKLLVPGIPLLTPPPPSSQAALQA
jgi:hypothetical protein